MANAASKPEVQDTVTVTVPLNRDHHRAAKIAAIRLGTTLRKFIADAVGLRLGGVTNAGGLQPPTAPEPTPAPRPETSE
jgi:hypothetical protein